MYFCNMIGTHTPKKIMTYATQQPSALLSSKQAIHKREVHQSLLVNTSALSAPTSSLESNLSVLPYPGNQHSWKTTYMKDFGFKGQIHYVITHMLGVKSRIMNSRANYGT